MIDAGADCLLIGCSEFSLTAELIRLVSGRTPVIDTLDELVKAAIKFSLQNCGSHSSEPKPPLP